MKNNILTAVSVFIAVIVFTGFSYAGLAEGPLTAVNVFPAMTKTSFNILLKKEEVTSIIIRGNKSSDLDCFVYDKDNKLVTRDVDQTDVCVMRILPEEAGEFRLVVMNLGSNPNTASMDFN